MSWGYCEHLKSLPVKSCRMHLDTHFILGIRFTGGGRVLPSSIYVIHSLDLAYFHSTSALL